MNSDIRIKTNLPQHPKVTKLRRIVGNDSFRCLIQLWCQVAMIKPSGDISCWDEDDIEIAADWQGKRGAFYAAVTKVGLVDIDGKSKTIHDWAENNPWAVDAEVRSLRASKNQVKRWCIRTFGTRKEKTSFEEWYKKYQFNQGDNTTRILSVYEQYTNSNTPSPSPSPLPSPSPSPKEEATKIAHCVINYLNEKTNKNFKKIDTNTDLIKILLKKGFVEEDFYKAIDNQVAAWANDEKMSPYLRPKTLFGPKFDGYVNNGKGVGYQNTCQLCSRFCAPSSPDKCHKSATIKACKEFTSR